MNDDKLTDEEMDALFEAARDSQMAPSPDWLARVSADAVRELQQTRPVPAPSIWEQLSDLLGGWRGFGGMAVASAAGLWIGIAPPAMLGDPVSTAMGDDSTVEVFSATQFEFSGLLDEG